jgi:hypothetical protein
VLVALLRPLLLGALGTPPLLLLLVPVAAASGRPAVGLLGTALAARPLAA